MAIRDVKDYYIKMLNQAHEMKEDLADFDQALKDGFITEDQVAEAKQDCSKIQENLDRLTYIMFLLNMPKRKEKQKKYIAENQQFIEYFENQKADVKAVELENIDMLKHLREELKKLKK